MQVSWTLLFFLTVSAALEQYDKFGAVSGNMWVMVVAHFLYSNACQKVRVCIYMCLFVCVVCLRSFCDLT